MEDLITDEYKTITSMIKDVSVAADKWKNFKNDEVVPIALELYANIHAKLILLSDVQAILEQEADILGLDLEMNN